MHAEWTKLRTVTGTLWSLLTAVALTVALSAGVAAVVSCPSAGCGGDATRLSLTGVGLGQAVVAILGVIVISNEYATGMIRTTLTAMPRRTATLAAKAAVLTGVVLVAATFAVLSSLLAGRLLLPGNGFTPAHGYPSLSPADGPTLRAATGSVLYLALIALLALGIATAARNAATAMGIVLGLLYLPPVIAQVISNPDWQERLQQIAPMPAGLSVQATTDLRSLPIGPWAGLGVLAAWAAAALLTGGLLLRLRDA
ncbi:ABC transporter permease [Actinomadura scrupuli]|uniref:ABC transporter permease n=1 Tax=Actinomadura scrupuli TaxID=559629 RepID=UPI003D99C347